MTVYCTLPRGSSSARDYHAKRPTVCTLFNNMPPLPPPPLPVHASPYSNQELPLPPPPLNLPLPPPPPMSSICDDPGCDGVSCLSSSHNASSSSPSSSAASTTSSNINIHMSKSETYLSDQQQQAYQKTSSHSLSTPTTPLVAPIEPRLYYAVDSFDDLKAIRRNSITNLSDDPLNPNFYGDDDSAYDSTSNESLRSSLKDVRKYKNSSSKYFTLPTRLGRRMKKMNNTNTNSTIQSDQRSSSSSTTSETSSMISPTDSNNYAIYSPLPSSQLPPISNTANDTHPQALPRLQIDGQEMADFTTTTNVAGVVIGSNNCSNNSNGCASEYHCCCAMGCHDNNRNEMNHLPNQDNNDFNGSIYENNKQLHCCHKKLETLWEEPNQINNPSNEVS